MTKYEPEPIELTLELSKEDQSIPLPIGDLTLDPVHRLAVEMFGMSYTEEQLEEAREIQNISLGGTT